MSRNRQLLIVGLAVGVLGYILVRPPAALARDPKVAPVPPTPIPTPLIGLGRVESGNGLVQAATDVAGIVAAVPVRAGDQVSRGALLVQLSDDAIRREADAARGRLEVQRRRIAAFEAATLVATARRDRAERTLARLRAVAQAGEVSADQLDSAETALVITRAELTNAHADEQIARADVIVAARDLAAAEARVAQRALRAPFAARVLRVDVQPGEAIAAGSGVVELAPLGAQVVRCELDELVAEDVRLGARGTVRPLAGDSIWARGRIVAAAPGLARKSLFAEVAGEEEDRRVREVRLELGGTVMLPFNARVECVIDRASVATRFTPGTRSSGR